MEGEERRTVTKGERTKVREEEAKKKKIMQRLPFVLMYIIDPKRVFHIVSLIFVSAQALRKKGPIKYIKNLISIHISITLKTNFI